MAPRNRNVLVGLVVLVALTVLVWMFLLFAGRATALFAPKGMPITLTAERADGLSDGSPIYYRGKEVGRVEQVRLTADGNGVLITAVIDKQASHVPSNLRGEIRTQSALGSNANIALEPAGPSTRPLQPNDTIKAEFVGLAFFPREFTNLAEDVRRQELVRHLDETVLSIHKQTEKTGQILDSVNGIVGDPKNREDLRVAIARIRDAAESASRVGTGMEKFTGDLQALTERTNTTLVSTNKHVDDLARDLGDNMQRLGKILDRMQTVADKIDHGKGTAALLVNDPRLYEGLADTSKELSLTVATLQRLANQWEKEGLHLRLGR